ncbi:putative ribonuclease H-like domain-containing protein [Tanacetum coccineum]
MSPPQTPPPRSQRLHKGYDRFQSLLSQLEIHGAGVSIEDANQKFLRVFESDVKGSTASSSSTQNVAFVSSENTSNTNNGSFTRNRRKMQVDAKESLALTRPKLSASIAITHWHFAREYRSKGNQESRRRDAGNTRYKAKDNGRRPVKQEEPKALVTIDGDGVDWTSHAEDEQENFALMAHSNSGSNTEVELNKKKGKGSVQGENRPIWNNVQRLNHQNKFVPKAVLTKTGIFPVNTARQNLSSQATATSNARKTTTPKANFANHKVNTAGDKTVSAVGGNREIAVKASTGCNWRSKRHYWNKVFKYNSGSNSSKNVNSKDPLKLKQFNLFSVSQMCDKKNKVLFTDSECLVLSPDFKLPDENQVLLRVPRQNNMYSFNLENIVPTGGLACLITKATVDESNKWHRRLGHVNFKNLNKLVKGNLVRGLPSKIFQNDHTCVACQKGKQHKASWNIMISVGQKGSIGCGSKGIKREYSNARTPQQNGVAERKNKTLIEAARTMLVTLFGLKYYIRPFGCHVTILNTIDHLGKFEEKSDEGFLVGEGPNWLFDLDYLTDSMNYQPVTTENKANKTAGPKEANHSTGTQDNIDAGNSEMEAEPAQEYFVLPLWSSYTSTVKSSEAKNGDENPNGDTSPKTNEEPKDQEDQAFLEKLERLKRQEKEANDAAKAFRKEFAQCTKDLLLQAGAARATSTNTVNTVSTPISTASPSRVFSTGGPDLTNNDQDDSQIPALEDIYDNPSDGIFTNASYNDEGAVAEFTNLETTVNVSPIPTSRIHSIHPTTQILEDPTSAIQTRCKVNKSSGTHAFVSYIQKQRRNNHKDFQHCLFACFISQIEPKKISQALEDESWVDAMQEELLQFKIQKVWILVDLPFGKKAIGTKWVYRNKKDERGVVVRNKARIEAIRIFFAFASYMGFVVYHMDVKSAFLYGTIDEEVYVSQPLSFVDPKFPKKVYKVVKALYGLHQAPRAWYATLSTFLLKNGYRRGTIDKTLFIKKNKNDIMLVQFQQKEDGIFISQDKYVAEILKKFDFDSVKTASTPIETQKPLIKDEEAADVDVHLYRSMIGSLMYLTASRPDIMYAVCACSRFQVTPKTSHLHAVKRIFRYLKGKPKLGLWYPRVSSFDLEAYSDSDYAGANLDRKSTTGGCQFLGRRLISWQCKKQTIVATSTTEAEYVAAANCCGQVLWIQNQMLDYGFNFMNTKIYIDNESTICIVKNLVFHSKTKHIEIRHHFIRDAYEKKLIQVLKIHSDDNVADLLAKAFDVTWFTFLIVNIGMLNQ